MADEFAGGGAGVHSQVLYGADQPRPPEYLLEAARLLFSKPLMERPCTDCAPNVVLELGDTSEHSTTWHLSVQHDDTCPVLRRIIVRRPAPS